MVGRRNERYGRFGTAAARADDVANWPAARLAGALTVALAAPPARRPRRDARARRPAAPAAATPPRPAAATPPRPAAGPRRAPPPRLAAHPADLAARGVASVARRRREAPLAERGCDRGRVRRGARAPARRARSRTPGRSSTGRSSARGARPGPRDVARAIRLARVISLATAVLAIGAAMKGAILITGTASDAGKSVMVAAICRWLKRQGVRVAPFKAQNMSLNCTVTPQRARRSGGRRRCRPRRAGSSPRRR